MKQKTKYLLFFPIIAAITIFIFRPITASTADMDAQRKRRERKRLPHITLQGSSLTTQSVKNLERN